MDSSLGQECNAREPIARLIGRLSSSSSEETWDIWPNQTLWIGRDGNRCHIVDSDPAVSNWHLKIYSVLFEGGTDIDAVAPLVYAVNFSRFGTLWNGIRIPQGHQSILLSHGDHLELCPATFFVFDCKPVVESQPFSDVQELFQKDYQITTRRLGAGGYGSVHLAIKQATKCQLACKVIALRGPRPVNNGLDLERGDFRRTFDIQMREVEILKKLDHPNIMRLEKVFYSEMTMYIFTELMTAGDLFSYLEYKGGRLDYCVCGVIVRQLLEGLQYLHGRGIVHRDIKPDNIFMTSLEDGARVVLGDFGWARAIPGQGMHRERMHTFCGTKEYLAPEMYKDTNKQLDSKGYTKAIDMWSIGHLTVVLFTGSTIFDISSKGSEDAMYKPPNWSFESLELILDDCEVDRRPKDFIKKLLVIESERLTATQALNHCWFTHARLKDSWDEVYRRSLQTWKPGLRRPRLRNGNIIERLIIPDVPKEKTPPRQTSKYFHPQTPLPSIAEELEITADNGSVTAHIPSSLPSPQLLATSDSTWRRPTPPQQQNAFPETLSTPHARQINTSTLSNTPNPLSSAAAASIRIPDRLPSIIPTRKRNHSIYSLSADQDLDDTVATRTKEWRTAQSLDQAAAKKRKRELSSFSATRC